MEECDGVDVGLTVTICGESCWGGHFKRWSTASGVLVDLMGKILIDLTRYRVTWSEIRMGVEFGMWRSRGV